MFNLQYLAKFIILTGALIMAIGVILLFADKIPWLGRLPGDVYVQRKNFSFYFPITTSIIISLLLSVILFFLSRR